MSNFTLSSHAKKANKKSAYAMAEQLKLGETLTPEQVDSLLLYFAPSIPKKAATAMQWVAKAVAIKDVRYYLTYIRVQDGFAYGTDGNRIHKAAVELPEGWYCPKTLVRLEGVDAKYPEIERLLTRTNNKIYNQSLDTMVKGISNKIPYLLTEKLDVGVDALFIADAVNGLNEKVILEFEQYNSSYRVRGTSDFGEWLVMPMRV